MRHGSIHSDSGGDDCFFEEPVCPEFSGYKTKSRLVLSRIIRGLKRSVLVNAALLLCTASVIAQSPGDGGTVVNPTTVNRNRQMARYPEKPAEQPSSAVEVPPDTPVVTLKGVCDPAKKSESQDCKTVYTREQMDKFVAQMAPNAPPALHPQIAIKYVRTLAAAKLAEDRKLENNPTVAVQLEKQTQLGHMQVLAKAFYRQIEEAAENPPMTELQQYYAEHLSQFEEGEVLRLSIPKFVLKGGRLDPALVKAEVDSLHRRASLGYDFDQLQVQAYIDLGIAQTPPLTKLTMARRSSMPPDQSEVYNLQPGEVTPVIDSYTSLVILKLVSKRTASFDSVIPEIRSDLKPVLLMREIHSASKNISAEFNLQYLGVSAQPELFPLSENTSKLSQSRTSPGTPNRTSSQRHTPGALGRTPPQLQSNP